MKWIFPCMVALAPLLVAEQEMKQAEKTEQFEVSSVIAAPLAELATHIAVGGLGESELIVFSESEAARVHVRKGFLLINASWDFEAYRHFTSALKADPECLLAYCGIVLSLTNPEHEFKLERSTAFNRMLSLAEHKVDGEFYYPENERMYAVGLAELMVNGPRKGARVFQQLAKNYPNDLQAQLFSLYLSRGGYNALGNARVSQREAVKNVAKLAELHPENLSVLNFQIMLQAEAPHQAVDFKKELLPVAQKLVKLSEGKVASWQALLGFVAWRSGELEVAEQAFRDSSKLYQEWMENNSLSYADNEGLIRSQLFLVSVLHEQGKSADALKLCSEINGYAVDKGRESSTGALALKWQAALMQSKLHIEAGDLGKAKKALPKLGRRKKLDLYSAVVMGYQLYVEASLMAEAGKESQALQLHARSAKLLTTMKEMQVSASSNPAFGDYLRSLNSLTVLHNELTAKVSGAGGLAYNWYQSAIDAQRQGSRLLPADILYPMEYRMGMYFLKRGEKERAKEAFEAALQRRPSYRKAAQQIKNL